ncbi:MAG: outer membrane beta-barrel protein [Pseudomonadota bacterium]
MRGWAVSGTLGASKIEDRDGTDKFSGDDFGYSAELEFRFNDHFALGGGIFNLGRASDTFGGIDTRIEAAGVEFFARGIYPISNSVELFGRLGGAIYTVDIDPGGVGLEDIFGDDAIDLGVGIDFVRSDALSFRVEGRFFDGDDAESGSLIGVGINYRF